MNEVFKKLGDTPGTYGYMVDLVECPCCKAHFPETSVRMHVYHIARSEVWQRALGEIEETPHFDLYRKSTVAVRNKAHRKWRI